MIRASLPGHSGRSLDISAVPLGFCANAVPIMRHRRTTATSLIAIVASFIRWSPGRAGYHVLMAGHSTTDVDVFLRHSVTAIFDADVSVGSKPAPWPAAVCLLPPAADIR